ncbi:MAG: YpdA family putative bacillithiol disulfide reductase, partial [Acidobacteria bacterium]|nr:YpdA family putative bacillithiol disulfide reductase [Acidobacteriota bacterium]
MPTDSVNPIYDVLCIGAGPTGMACAIEAKRAGLRVLVVDKGFLCNSLFHYPVNIIFFTTPELMEIGDLPMTTTSEKPTRAEALKYYRKAAEHYALELRLYESVEHITGGDGNFTVHTLTAVGEESKYSARKIVVATGYYDLPNRLGISGEDLPHVSHYYTEAHPCWGQDVVVVGGKNSAAEAALDLWRGGARVTLVHRRAELGASIKYWVRPDIENRIKAGQIAALFETEITRIEPDTVFVNNAQGSSRVPATAVFLLTGYHPDFDFLRGQGIALDETTMKPECNPETLESNVPGIYLAGVILGGR